MWRHMVRPRVLQAPLKGRTHRRALWRQTGMPIQHIRAQDAGQGMATNPVATRPVASPVDLCKVRAAMLGV